MEPTEHELKQPVPILEQLQSGELDIDTADELKNTLLLQAVTADDIELARYILDQRPEFSTQPYRKYSDLHPMEPEKSVWSEFTLLQVAKSAAMVKFLIDHGVQCTFTSEHTKHGRMPSWCGPEYSPLGTMPHSAVQELLPHITQERQQHLNMGLAERLIYPRTDDDYAIAKLLMEQGARLARSTVFELMISDQQKEFPVEDADLLEYMLDYRKLNPDITNEDGDTFLQLLLAQPLTAINQRVAEKFMAAGAHINRFNKGGGDYTIQRDALQNLEKQRRHAALSHQSGLYKSALYRAIESGDARNVAWALEQGADATGELIPKSGYQRSREDSTLLKKCWVSPLYYAMEHEFSEAVALLMPKLQGKKEAIQSVEGYNSFSALEVAAWRGLTDIVFSIAKYAQPNEALEALKIVGLGGGTREIQNWKVRMGNDSMSGIDLSPEKKPDYESFHPSNFDALHQHLVQTQAIRTEDWPNEQGDDPRFSRLIRTLATLNRFIQLYDLQHLEKTGQGHERHYSPLLSTWFSYINEITDHFNSPDDILQDINIAEMEKQYPRFEIAVQILYQNELADMTKDAPINDDIRRALVRRVIPIALLGIMKLKMQPDQPANHNGLALFDPGQILAAQQEQLIQLTSPELFPIYQELILGVCTRTMQARFAHLKHDGSPTYSPVHFNAQSLKMAAQADQPITSLSIEANWRARFPATIELKLAQSTIDQPEQVLLASAQQSFENMMSVVQGYDYSDPRSQYALAVATLCECVTDLNLAMQQLNHGEGHPGLSGNAATILKTLTQAFKDISITGAWRFGDKEQQIRTQFFATLSQLEALVH